jgi:mevalonate kinase
MSSSEFYSDLDSDDSKERVSNMLADIDRRKEKEPELYESVNKAYEDAEKAYNNEDEKMLIQLVKIRKSLWT